MNINNANETGIGESRIMKVKYTSYYYLEHKVIYVMRFDRW